MRQVAPQVLIVDNRRRLDDLVRNPREGLDVELKAWLDLDQREHQADLAKAILALANHDGGYVLVGYDDETRAPAEDSEQVGTQYDQDRVNGVLQRYAEPQIHVDVEFVECADGTYHPVIIVPGGHTVPILCRRDGPNGAHVKQNTIYIRRPGPESSEPQSAAEWAALMRKCVLADRDTLLDQMRTVISPMSGAASAEGAPLPSRHREWVESSQQRFEELNEEAFGGLETSPFSHGYWRAAYTVEPPIAELTLASFRRRYRNIVGSETGWPVGLELHREDAAPRPYEGCMELWLAESLDDPAVSDYWRASPEGNFALFRGYQDDSREWEGRENPGTEFEFIIPIWRVGELLLHGQRFVEHFADAEAGLQVSMTWTGLAGRRIRNSQPGRYIGIYSRSAQQNEVSVSLTIDNASRISANLPELVQEATQPLYEIFDFLSVPAQTIRHELEEMRRR